MILVAVTVAFVLIFSFKVPLYATVLVTVIVVSIFGRHLWGDIGYRKKMSPFPTDPGMSRIPFVDQQITDWKRINY